MKNLILFLLVIGAYCGCKQKTLPSNAIIFDTVLVEMLADIYFNDLKGEPLPSGQQFYAHEYLTKAIYIAFVKKYGVEGPATGKWCNYYAVRDTTIHRKLLEVLRYVNPFYNVIIPNSLCADDGPHVDIYIEPKLLLQDIEEGMVQKMWCDAERKAGYRSLFNNGKQGPRFDRGGKK